MGAYAPDETVAQVRALALQGFRMPTISKRTGVPVSTVHRWLREWESLGTEQDREMLDQERRIALLAARIYEDKLEAAADGREPIKVTEAGIAYGISRSKIHERAQRSQAQPSGNTYVFMQAPQQLAEPASSGAHVGMEPARAEPRTGKEPSAHVGMELEATFRPIKSPELDTGADSGALRDDPGR